VSSIAKLVKAIGPDKVQLNTAVRPPCEEYAYAVPPEQMESLAQLFDPPAEVIAEYSTDLSVRIRTDEAAIRHMLGRRPCTLGEICQAFGLHRNEASKYLGKLVRTGQVEQREKNGERFYSGVHSKALGPAAA
jgi:wyosine [tRNA(Phe)-imidazoG37] synthetase (radical SAM superfamily)